MGKPKKKKGKSSTQGLTSTWELLDIPLLKREEQACWKVRCLGWKNDEGKVQSPVFDQIKKWCLENESEFEKLLRSIRYAAANQIHRNQDKVRQDREKRGGYEFKATHCKCRVMFFYDQDEKQLIVCTNAYWKGKGGHQKDQDRAFELCAELKKEYLKTKGKKR